MTHNMRLRRAVRDLRDFFQGSEPVSTMLGRSSLAEYTAQALIEEIGEAVRDGELGQWEGWDLPAWKNRKEEGHVEVL